MRLLRSHMNYFKKLFFIFQITIFIPTIILSMQRFAPAMPKAIGADQGQIASGTALIPQEYILNRIDLTPDRSLIQIRTVNQSKKPLSNFGGSTCPILALYNAIHLLQYGQNFNPQELGAIVNEREAVQFINTVGSCFKDWNNLTSDQVEGILDRVGIPHLKNNLVTLNSVLEMGRPEEFIGQENAQRMHNIMNTIQQGLLQDTFAFAFILGNSEMIDSQVTPGTIMHYSVFAIIKKNNHVYYIVADTLNNQNHLEGIYLKQLYYLINTLRRGYWESRYKPYLKDLKAAAEQRKNDEIKVMLELQRIYGQEEQAKFSNIQPGSIASMFPVTPTHEPHVFKLNPFPLQQQEKFPEISLVPYPSDLIKASLPVKPNTLLIQLDALSQFDVGQKHGYATCAPLALRTADLAVSYARSGHREFLKRLKDLHFAQEFLNRVQRCGSTEEWFTDDMIKGLMKKLVPANAEDISVISSVFDLEGSPIITNIRNGLKQEHFAHAIILGTDDDDRYAGRPYHYFTFLILKKGTNIQYVVIDTAPLRDHTKGFDNVRLRYLIDMIETGRSDIDFNDLALKEATKSVF